MTRAKIVLEAARRLGDESSAFLTEVDGAFDFVLQDLAAHEVLGDLRKVATAATVVADQRDYSTRDLTGLAAPAWPDRILSLRVWAWGVESEICQVTDQVFEALRAAAGEDVRGRPRIWRLYPNARTVQVHPPADGDAEGETIECLYLAPPTVIASGTEIEEIRREDLETIVFGLQARLGPFLEETASDPAAAWQLYVAGRDRMWGRRFNNRVGQMGLADQ